MYVIKLKNILIFGVLITAMIVMCNCTFSHSKKIETMASRNYTDLIVIDAGHGFPDGGATVGDIVEADLNLMIAKKLETALEERGYDILMTREDENNIADSGEQESLARMKASDLNNRVKMINESGADFCISIHMNKYTNGRFWGWQTFYNENSEEGKKLARLIQENISKKIPKNNKRTELKIEGIKIVDKTNIPVVIVECGFISNLEEAQLLQNETYQLQLVEGICDGVEEFYETTFRDGS